MELMTLFNIPWQELDKSDLAAEIRCQKALMTIIKKELNVLNKARENKKPSRIREDKIEFFEMYMKVLGGLVGEMQEKFDKTYSVAYDNTKYAGVKAQKRWHRYQRDRLIARNKANTSMDGVKLSWDRDKFMLVARDRGYLTEQSVIQAVAEELLVSREMSKMLLNKGKYTWGQVMCLGAMLQMTPKEFCDIFLSGYFTEYYGRYIASYDNIDREVLLKRARTLTLKEVEELDSLAESLPDDEV